MSNRREWLKLALWLGGGALTLKACGFIGSPQPTDDEKKAFPEAGETKMRPPINNIPAHRPSWADKELARPIQIVVVKSSMMTDKNTAYASYAVANYLRNLLSYGFTLDDIADHTKAIYQIDLYVGEVGNGGHGQYVENTQLPEPTIRYCRQGLDMVGAKPYLDIFDKMISIMHAPDQAKNLVDGAFGSSPEIKVLNKEYFRLHAQKPIGAYVKEFLAKSSWFHTISETEYPTVMAWISEQK